MAALTQQQTGLLGRYTRYPQEADPAKLEEMADRLLGLGRRGRRPHQEYPVLSARQRKTRTDREVPLGGLVEQVSFDPAATFIRLRANELDVHADLPAQDAWDEDPEARAA